MHEVDGFSGSVYGFTALIETNQFYYWLVPGLGVAVQITMYGNNVLDPSALPLTNSVERMYFASYFTNTVSAPSTNSTVGNLHIKLESRSVVLSWNPFTNSPSSYEVQANGKLTGTNWQSLGLTSGTNWTDSLSTTSRFYRVVGPP